jgi:hypothetical protein
MNELEEKKLAAEIAMLDAQTRSTRAQSHESIASC